jgi:hypothetical protein
MGLGSLLGTIVTGGRWSAETGWVGTFTAEPGEFKRGNRVEVPNRWGRPKIREVIDVQQRYDQRNQEAYDQGRYRTVSSLRGCNCGHPGCPG